MTRELRQVAGLAQRARAWRAGLRLVTLALGLSLGSCLVTENNDLVAPTDVPVVRVLAPEIFSPVRFGTDPDCTGVVTSRAMQFKISVRYQDTSEDLVIQIFVNGSAVGGARPLKPNEERSVDRVPDTICVEERLLDRACSLVQVSVSSNLIKVQRNESIGDPEVSTAQWFILGSADKYADADLRNDCLALVSRPDGGL
jgi:hypothetical protein